MIQTNKIRALIVERGLTQRKVANELGITEKTFYLKMKKGVFTSTEMEALIKLLNITDPIQIFFANTVA